MDNKYQEEMSSEISDLRREREIFTEEILSGKNTFANELNDTLGEQIKKELEKKPKEVKPIPEKKSKIKRFFDKLSQICQ